MLFSWNKGSVKFLVILGALSCLILAYGFFTGPKRMELPAEMYGEWFSEDPRYRSCYLDISPDTLIIGAADGNVYHYDIQYVQEAADSNNSERSFILFSQSPDDVELEFRLIYDSKRGLISYKNQRHIIWFQARGQEG